MGARERADDTEHSWKPAPYRPHWHADFWGDSRVLNMTLEEAGLYMRLLDMHWVNGTRGISANRERLLQVVPKLSSEDALDNVLTCFTSDGAPKGRLVNSRSLKEIAGAAVRMSRASLGGKAAKAARQRPR